MTAWTGPGGLRVTVAHLTLTSPADGAMRGGLRPRPGQAITITHADGVTLGQVTSTPAGTGWAAQAAHRLATLHDDPMDALEALGARLHERMGDGFGFTSLAQLAPARVCHHHHARSTA